MDHPLQNVDVDDFLEDIRNVRSGGIESLLEYVTRLRLDPLAPWLEAIPRMTAEQIDDFVFALGRRRVGLPEHAAEIMIQKMRGHASRAVTIARIVRIMASFSAPMHRVIMIEVMEYSEGDDQCVLAISIMQALMDRVISTGNDHK